MARTSLLKQAQSLSVRPDKSLRLVVVADTHSAPHSMMNERLTMLKPDAILHGGDIGDLSVLDELRKHAPLIAVRGNIDERADNLPDAVTLDVVDEQTLLLRILLVHIAVNGPKLRADVLRMAQAACASMVVCGHSHVPFIGRDRDITIFNPGSIGPRRFQLPIVFGSLNISQTPTQSRQTELAIGEVSPTTINVQLSHMDCETGLKWSPPGLGKSGVLRLH